MMGWRSHDEAAEQVTGHEASGPIINPAVPAPNLSTNSGGDTTNNLNTGANVKAGGETPPATPAVEPSSAPQKQDPGQVAWNLLLEGVTELDATSMQSANSRWRVLRESAMSRSAFPKLSSKESNDLAAKYVAKTRDIYAAAYHDCIQLLASEGYDFQGQSPALEDEWSSRISQDIAKDVSDYVFGIGYSRSMKALLRDAFEEGMSRAGLDLTDKTYKIDESLIERVWKTNRQFVLKLRDELRSALRDQSFGSLVDIKDWFDARSWREDLMGRFLAKQGISAGYAYGISVTGGSVSFTWTRSGVDSCPTCISRDGQSFTYDELTSVGFPGSIELECGANCRCSLDPE